MVIAGELSRPAGRRAQRRRKHPRCSQRHSQRQLRETSMPEAKPEPPRTEETRPARAGLSVTLRGPGAGAGEEGAAARAAGAARPPRSSPLPTSTLKPTGLIRWTTGGRAQGNPGCELSSKIHRVRAPKKRPPRQLRPRGAAAAAEGCWTSGERPGEGLWTLPDAPQGSARSGVAASARWVWRKTPCSEQGSRWRWSCWWPAAKSHSCPLWWRGKFPPRTCR